MASFPKEIAQIIAEYTSDGWDIAKWLRDLEPYLAAKYGQYEFLKGMHLSYNLTCKINSSFEINWTILSLNSSDWALDLLETNPSKINFGYLSVNTNPRAKQLLSKARYIGDPPSTQVLQMITKQPKNLYELKRNPSKIDMTIFNHPQIIEQYDSRLLKILTES